MLTCCVRVESVMTHTFWFCITGVHEKGFIGFMVCSQLYMVLSVFLFKRSRAGVFSSTKVSSASTMDRARTHVVKAFYTCTCTSLVIVCSIASVFHVCVGRTNDLTATSVCWLLLTLAVFCWLSTSTSDITDTASREVSFNISLALMYIVLAHLTFM